MIDKVYWEWFCSLVPNYTAPKIDAKLKKCECGYSWHFNKLHYILMLIFDGYVFTCPQCQRKHYYRLFYHAVEEHEETRAGNNELSEAKEKIWERC